MTSFLTQPADKKPTLARFFVACLMFSFVPAMTSAEPLAAHEGISLEEAVSLALAGHPALRAQSATIMAVQHQSELDSLAPPVVVSSEVENIAGSGDLHGTSSVEATIRLSRVIELGGKRDTRRALGRANVDQQRYRAERARIEVAAETTRRFVQVLATQRQVKLTLEEVSRAEEMRSHVGRWVEAGRNPESDRHQADIALGRARLAQEDAEHELLTTRTALAALWGERELLASQARGDLDNLPVVEDFAILAARLPDSVDQQGFRKEADALDARRQAAAASATPDVSVSVGVRRLEAVNDQALVFGVSLPLGSGPRSALGVARYGAELEAVEAAREAASLDTYQRLFSLYQELQHARHVVETHRDELIPMAEQALQVNRRGYELGRFSFLVMNQSQQQLAELRTTRIEAAAQYHALLVDIERLTANTGAATP